MLQRLPLLLTLLLLLVACDPQRDSNDPNTTTRITSLSTHTPSVGGTLTIRGSGFSTETNTITIGSATVPADNITTHAHDEIALTIPAGAPNGYVTITTDDNKTASSADPIQIIASLQVEPLAAEPDTRVYPITAHAKDTNGDPVPGARLTLNTGHKGTLTPGAIITTNANGTAKATLDLTGVDEYVELVVWAQPLRVIATYQDSGTYDLGTEVTLTHDSTRMPIYVHLDDNSQTATITTLNHRPDSPPTPRAITTASIPTLTPLPEPDRIIIKYRSGLTLSAASRTSTITAAGLQPLTSTATYATASVPDSHSLEDALAALNADPRVEYAEPDYYVRLSALPNDPQFHQQWGAFAIGAPNAWSVSRGAGITVAVIDSAIDTSHPDLTTALLPGYDFCADNRDCSTHDNDPHAGTGAANHGTHVAGIIAAQPNNGHGTAGMAPDTRILPVKVFAEGTDLTTTSTVALAVRWAAGLPTHLHHPSVPSNPNPAQVINLSLGGPDSSAHLEEAINDAVANGVTVIAAVGNEGEAGINHPAKQDNVIGVGAIDENWDLAIYSNYGPGVDLVAPGTRILATLPGAHSGLMTGTSMATPHVAAAAALLLSHNPNLSPTQVKNALKATAYKPDDAFTHGYGAGVVRADGLLGLPAPTNDTDRYATIHIGQASAPLDLIEGITTLNLPRNGKRDEIRMTHSGHHYTGHLPSP